ncbi:MAG: hypothetical protein K5790_02845 [Nitrosopumilus sp.]|uniref:hypothetical protein n=1 Tax=Nitrosopumilus sp. TaxID=2024843 RepID=UPI00247E28F4|nr:hypothetical protein [Nitrosopumilus sp.]MCV0392214.1 hypothetical protein [Nitrosopumilus sp.]
MEEVPNPVKAYLFDYIKNSETIPKLISEKRFDQIIDEIIQNCYDNVLTLGEKDEVVGILATGILHYLLTNALITSQRNIEYKGIELDIVVPDTKTLESDPEKTLLICIPKSSKMKVIEERITQLEKCQKISENIWVVLSENISIEKKLFVLSKENNTFSKIIFEIANFTNVGGTNKFKILRI